MGRPAPRGSDDDDEKFSFAADAAAEGLPAARVVAAERGNPTWHEESASRNIRKDEFMMVRLLCCCCVCYLRCVLLCYCSDQPSILSLLLEASS